MMVGTEADMEEGMVVEAMVMTTMEEAMATTMGTAGAMDMTMVMEKAEVRGQGPAALSKAPTVSATTARYEIGDSMDMGMILHKKKDEKLLRRQDKFCQDFGKGPKKVEEAFCRR